MSKTEIMKTGHHQALDFRGINILYYALVVGQFLIACTLLFMMKDDEISFGWDMNDILHVVGTIVFISCLTIGTFLYNKKLSEGKSLNGFLEKLGHYRETIILRSALLEGGNLICIIFFFLVQNYFFLLLFIIGFCAFLLVRPSVNTFKENYKLNEEERLELRKMISK